MGLKVISPSNLVDERKYIINIILDTFLGLNFTFEAKDNLSETIIEFENKQLILRDCLFRRDDSHHWLKQASLPGKELAVLDSAKLPVCVDLIEPELPVIYGDAGIKLGSDYVSTEIDILGSCFFMLTRYEEYIIPDKDQFGRFPAASSVACKHSFIHRPIVNEYVELLWACMTYLWPNLKRTKKEFKITPTHDMDRPFQFTNKKWTTILKHVIEQAIIRGKPNEAMCYFKSAFQSKVSSGADDPYNTITYLLNQSAKRKLCSEFYFLVQTTDHEKDGDYSLKDVPITRLMGLIHSNSQLIGLHPSYNSYLSETQIVKELSLLREHSRSLGIDQPIWGGRQHYLRMKIPETIRHLNNAGINYDSTIYYAEKPGFRLGCCFEFPLFDVNQRETLSIVERPLILMDSSFLDGGYQELTLPQKKQQIKSLKDSCKKYQGNFMLLWHNSNLTTPELRHLYEYALDC